MSLQMQSQHQMAIQNYCHCKCRANIKWSYKIIVIANAEPTSNGYTKLLSLQMQSQHQMAIRNYCLCKCRAKEKKKSNGTVENILKIQDKNCINNLYIMTNL